MKADKSLMISFAPLLLKWNSEENSREMPWKGQKDPYKIWLSEIILQQTRVEQGLKYYNNFIKSFPDVHALASASEQTVYKLWEGLGYYSRCRNLIKSAQYISRDLQGRFPESYEDILKLKGVGEYTASAIASFAYNLSHAVVDGNVYRVLSRIFGIKMSIGSSEGKVYFSKLANKLLDKEFPGIYNQAIMDYGAVICRPVPKCNICVFRKNCYAYQNGEIASLPVKPNKVVLKKRWFYYLVLEYNDLIAVRRRSGKDIWHNLFEYYLVEKPRLNSYTSILKQAEKEGMLDKDSYNMISVSKLYTQKLSHQFIAGQFINIKVHEKLKLEGDWKWYSKSNLLDLPFPKFINQYREEITGIKFDQV